MLARDELWCKRYPPWSSKHWQGPAFWLVRHLRCAWRSYPPERRVRQCEQTTSSRYPGRTGWLPGYRHQPPWRPSVPWIRGAQRPAPVGWAWVVVTIMSTIATMELQNALVTPHPMRKGHAHQGTSEVPCINLCHLPTNIAVSRSYRARVCVFHFVVFVFCFLLVLVFWRLLIFALCI